MKELKLPPESITIGKAAEEAGVSKRTVSRWLCKYKVDPFNNFIIGGERRITTSIWKSILSQEYARNF